jgi:Cu(I)/Ag(I) efflux system membrane fusion protein
MKDRRALFVRALLALALVAAGAAGGWWFARQSEAPAGDTAKNAAETGKGRILYWYDPMYPLHHFDKPGKSPFMDMDLVPKYADEGGGADAGVRIDPGITQNLGVRLALVERRRLEAVVEAVATIGFDERAVAIVQTRTGGFVERVYDRAEGDLIAKEAPLADLLVPEWAALQHEFLALRASGDAGLAAAARERMRLAGMPAALIARVERSGGPQAVLTISAPIGGVIEELGVRDGMTLPPGTTLARINGVDKVWLEAAVPEAQAALAREGHPVEARLPAWPGETFTGKVTAVLPQIQADTRTLRVRMELPNPDLRLRPGMSAQVRLAEKPAEALVVPAEAVIRTGTRAVALVATRDGRFRPVEITLGREAGDYLVVRDGLEEGQQVVASGQFLIDSEASLKGALAAMADEQPDAAGQTVTLHEASGHIEAIGSNEVTLSHGPVPSLGWGEMTMQFSLARPELAEGLKAGDQVRFAFRQTDSGFVAERLEKETP